MPITWFGIRKSVLFVFFSNVFKPELNFWKHVAEIFQWFGVRYGLITTPKHCSLKNNYWRHSDTFYKGKVNQVGRLNPTWGSGSFANTFEMDCFLRIMFAHETCSRNIKCFYGMIPHCMDWNWPQGMFPFDEVNSGPNSWKCISCFETHVWKACLLINVDHPLHAWFTLWH